jgi:hypothetical protein
VITSPTLGPSVAARDSLTALENSAAVTVELTLAAVMNAVGRCSSGIYSSDSYTVTRHLAGCEGALC